MLQLSTRGNIYMHSYCYNRVLKIYNIQFMLQDLCTPETNLNQFFLSQTLCLHLGCLARCTDAKVGIAWNWCTHESLTWRQQCPNKPKTPGTSSHSNCLTFATAGACTKCTRYTWRRPWHRKDGMEIWPFCLGLFLQHSDCNWNPKDSKDSSKVSTTSVWCTE